MLAIPDEIKKAIRQKKVRRVVLFLVTVLLMVVVIIMFREHAETNLVKRTVFQCFQRLCDQFVRL